MDHSQGKLIYSQKVLGWKTSNGTSRCYGERKANPTATGLQRNKKETNLRDKKEIAS